MGDYDPLHPVFHDPQVENFTVEDHLDKEILELLGGFMSIGLSEPIKEETE